jgi:hypothetical protein
MGIQNAGLISADGYDDVYKISRVEDDIKDMISTEVFFESVLSELSSKYKSFSIDFINHSK